MSVFSNKEFNNFKSIKKIIMKKKFLLIIMIAASVFTSFADKTIYVASSAAGSLWNIFIQIGGLALLLDFGFLSSFGRNITYIFSGVKELKAEGYVSVDNADNSISYSLLKTVINAMRRYYSIIALVFLTLFLVSTPFYLNKVLHDYNGNKPVIWVSWITYGILVAYQLYTYYYSSLLTGRGMIKKLHQTIVIGQVCRISTSLLLLYLGYGIISLVAGQLVSDIVNRILYYNAFYDKDLKKNLKSAVVQPVGDIMKIMSPNAIKIGVTTLGWFLTTKIIVLVAPLLSITLPTVGSIGKSGSINFSVANNVEMKVRNDKDTTGTKPYSIVSLIDNFSVSGAYNMAAD